MPTTNRGVIKITGAPPLVYDQKTLTADYTIQPSDNNLILIFNSSSNLTCTIPADFDFVDGFQVIIFQRGTGIVTVVADTGVTTLSANNELETRARYSMVHIIKIATNTYIVGGDLA